MFEECLDEEIALVYAANDMHTSSDQASAVRANNKYITCLEQIEVNIGLQIENIHGQKFVF